MPHRSLADIDHDPVIGKCRDNSRCHYAYQTNQIGGQTAEIPGAAFEHWCNVIINQRLGECRPYNSCDGSNQNADNYNQKRNFVIMKHISNDPVDQPDGCIHSGS